ncbi:MAG: TPM domain-containing protein [Candidatus Omnitrophica bacterium]|nr:TPM domain-containing protein [Candidatus Omnitrophota bacterium]
MRILRRVFLLGFFLLVFFARVYGEDIPAPSGFVNDFAGVISAEYKEKIDALIDELEQKTSAEIAVVTRTTIAPYGENDYSQMLFDKWNFS